LTIDWQSCFRAWKCAVHALQQQKQDASNFLYAFRAWRNHLKTEKAQKVAAEAVRKQHELEAYHLQELDRLKLHSMDDLEFEREQFNRSIT
jgi:DNA repair ATPase RecN